MEGGARPPHDWRIDDSRTVLVAPPTAHYGQASVCAVPLDSQVASWEQFIDSSNLTGREAPGRPPIETSHLEGEIFQQQLDYQTSGDYGRVESFGRYAARLLPTTSFLVTKRTNAFCYGGAEHIDKPPARRLTWSNRGLSALGTAES
jgi:hypothetical protein